MRPRALRSDIDDLVHIVVGQMDWKEEDRAKLLRVMNELGRYHEVEHFFMQKFGLVKQ